MSTILHIETATDVCSVALASGGKLISKREKAEGRSHATQLTVFIDELLKQFGNNPDAVAVSMGPGSYTGLRIGVSAAKGICYGLDIPLIAIPTLQSMFYGFVKAHAELSESAVLAPMIDARRMEVFTALYSKKGELIEDTSAKIIDEKSFEDILSRQELILFGDGADKLKGVLTHKMLTIIDNFKPSSEYMIKLAYDKFLKNEFEDLAYFVPFYLKNFITTVPKKNILLQQKKS